MLGRLLMSASAVWAGAGAFVFDWNETHISNPDWPPHAKFHNAQTMSLGAGLAAATVITAWAPGWSRPRLAVTAAASSLYWATQLSALAFPGTALVDPPRRDTHAQAWIASAGLAVNLLGVVLEARRRR